MNLLHFGTSCGFTKRIYADNAATTKPCEAAIKAATACMTDGYGNPSSLHTEGRQAAELLAAARETVARCIGADAKEIYFTSGGSEANNQAILSVTEMMKNYGKRHIVSTAFEHHSVLRPLEDLRRRGFEVTLLEVPESGFINPEQVRLAIRNDTCLVSVMSVNNEIGTVQLITDIGRICREKHVWFHTDAVQSVGHLPIDVKKLNVDFLTMSAHKFGGIKGAGALYARNTAPVKSLILGGAQERGKRAGTENMPGICAMAAALEEACQNMQERSAHTIRLRDALFNSLICIPGATPNGIPCGKHATGIVNVSFDGIEGETLALMLDAKGISVSTGSACTSGNLEPSHVLTAMGVSRKSAYSAIRFSLSHENTIAEVHTIIRTVGECVERLRRMKQ